MANCKDCIHCKVCCQKHLHVVTGMDFVYRYKYNHIERVCKDFKDRSRFVELPCERGNLVYFIKARRVMADIVSKFTIDRRGVMLQRGNGYNLGYTDQLGKKIFLTLEEAEQALKERENSV